MGCFDNGVGPTQPIDYDIACFDNGVGPTQPIDYDII